MEKEETYVVCSPRLSLNHMEADGGRKGGKAQEEEEGTSGLVQEHDSGGGDSGLP